MVWLRNAHCSLKNAAGWFQPHLDVDVVQRLDELGAVLLLHLASPLSKRLRSGSKAAPAGLEQTLEVEGGLGRRTLPGGESAPCPRNHGSTTVVSRALGTSPSRSCFAWYQPMPRFGTPHPIRITSQAASVDPPRRHATDLGKTGWLRTCCRIGWSTRLCTSDEVRVDSAERAKAARATTEIMADD